MIYVVFPVMSKSENLQSASSTVKPLWQVQTSPEHQRENKWRPWSKNNRTHSAWMWCMWMSLCEACERVVTLSLCHEQSAISYISDTYSVTYSRRGECPTFLSLCVQCFDCNVNASDFTEIPIFELEFQVLSDPSEEHRFAWEWQNVPNISFMNSVKR